MSAVLWVGALPRSASAGFSYAGRFSNWDPARSSGAAIGQRGKWGRGYLPTDGDIERVRALAAGGRSLRAIEAETSIPRSTVARILKATAAVPNGRSGQ